MFLFRLIGECIAAIAFPFILVSYAFKPGSYKETWQPLYRADTFFSQVPGYAEVIRDTMSDEELTEGERYEMCRCLEKDLVRAIRYAETLENRSAQARG